MKTAAGYVTDDENIHWASISLAWMGSKTRELAGFDGHLKRRHDEASAEVRHGTATTIHS
jgi:hypothetical protein